ncbi:sugar phosphate nucleotidyltransferase, partial [bacterium]
MKAFVMSAGEGTRLRPLTYDVPKPMIPVANKPVLENTIELLKKYGIRDIIINLYTHPQLIRNYFKDGKKFGVNITYSVEKKLKGTAGGVRKMSDKFDDTFIVMSGDGLIDIDLKKVISFHKKKKSIATIVLKRLDARFEYGVVFTKEDSSISKFVEKPAWADVSENRVNTGIYILEPEIFNYIPKNRFYDFGSNVWPKLIQKSVPFFAYETHGYWCDIGSLLEYRRAQRDVINQRLKFDIKGNMIKKGVWIGKNTAVKKTAKLAAPCIIGKNSIIEAGVFIGKDTVIGNDCFIDVGAEIHNCIIWDKVY